MVCKQPNSALQRVDGQATWAPSKQTTLKFITEIRGRSQRICMLSEGNTYYIPGAMKGYEFVAQYRVVSIQATSQMK